MQSNPARVNINNHYRFVACGIDPTVGTGTCAGHGPGLREPGRLAPLELSSRRVNVGSSLPAMRKRSPPAGACRCRPPGASTPSVTSRFTLASMELVVTTIACARVGDVDGRTDRPPSSGRTRVADRRRWVPLPAAMTGPSWTQGLDDVSSARPVFAHLRKPLVSCSFLCSSRLTLLDPVTP